METKTRCTRLGSWHSFFVFLVVLLLAANPAAGARRSRSKGARTGGQGGLNSTEAEDDTGQEDRRRGKFRKGNKIASSDVFLPFCTSTNRYVQGGQREKKQFAQKGRGRKDTSGFKTIVFPSDFFASPYLTHWNCTKKSPHFVKVGHARGCIPHISFTLSVNLFGIVRFPNSACGASDGRNGTCYTLAECASRGGANGGACARGFGVCCLCELIGTLNVVLVLPYIASPSPHLVVATLLLLMWW